MGGPDFVLSIVTSLLATILFELCRQGYLHRRIKKNLSASKTEKLVSPARFIQGSYANSIKVRPGFDVDILVFPHHGASRY
jgi:hypothetical protein